MYKIYCVVEYYNNNMNKVKTFLCTKDLQKVFALFLTLFIKNLKNKLHHFLYIVSTA